MTTRSLLGTSQRKKGLHVESITHQTLTLNFKLNKQVMRLATSEHTGTIDGPCTGIGRLFTYPGAAGRVSVYLPQDESKPTNQLMFHLNQINENKRLTITQAPSNKSRTRAIKQTNRVRSLYLQHTTLKQQH